MNTEQHQKIDLTGLTPGNQTVLRELAESLRPVYKAPPPPSPGAADPLAAVKEAHRLGLPVEWRYKGSHPQWNPAAAPMWTADCEYRIADGWKLHDGGKCPVVVGTKVEMLLSDGTKYLFNNPEILGWGKKHTPHIVAFRPLPAPVMVPPGSAETGRSGEMNETPTPECDSARARFHGSLEWYDLAKSFERERDALLVELDSWKAQPQVDADEMKSLRAELASERETIRLITTDMDYEGGVQDLQRKALEAMAKLLESESDRARLRDGLERIAKGEDAPDIDATGEWQTGLHCGVEDRDCQDRYQGADYGHTMGVERVLEWATNEAKSALADYVKWKEEQGK